MSELLVAAARLVPWTVAVPMGPVPVRVLIGAVLAVAVGTARGGAVATVSGWGLVGEAAIGLMLGLTAAIPLLAARAAGVLVDGARRPARARLRDGAVARLYGALALAAFALVDGPSLWVDAIARSYEILPVGAGTVGGLEVVIAAVARLLAAALELSAPVLAATVLAEVGLGLVARVAPALTRLFAATPGAGAGRALAALLAVAISAGGAAAWLGGSGRGLVASVTDAARLLGGR